ncbi:MAG: RNA polymerase sigma factor region1.1 domain-containing protein, partial [Desulfobacterales bacterium]|nr:RNA polymerase sigma factor region1.1 domain-containing protein [Desulfobacterales bacterium]
MAKKLVTKQKSVEKAGRKALPKKISEKQKAAKSVSRKISPKKANMRQEKIESNVNEKILKNLILKGKKQGRLTYDEINEAFPDDVLSSEQIDETLMIFDDLNIKVIDRNKEEISGSEEKTEIERDTTAGDDTSVADFGTVADPVKMYLREMGFVTLLSREGEVEIAKKIEAGEQEVL